MFLSVFTINLISTSAQIIACNTVPVRHQGVAGISGWTLLIYDLNTGLDFAGTVETHTSDSGNNLLEGYSFCCVFSD